MKKLSFGIFNKANNKFGKHQNLNYISVAKE